MSRRTTAYLLLLVTSVIWGVAGPVIKFTLQFYPPLIFLTYRFAISSFLALPYLARGHAKHMKNQRKIRDLVIHGVLVAPLALGLLFYGYDKTTSLTGSIISASAPILTIVLSAEFLREHVTRVERSGISLAFLGTLLIILGPFFAGNGMALGALEGNLLIVLALIVDTVGSLYVKILAREDVPAALVSHISFVIGFIILLPVTIAVHSPGMLVQTIVQAPPAAHLGVLFMAVLSGTVAYALRSVAVKTIELSEAAVFSYLYPLWAAPLAILWLGESVALPFVLGAGLIATGVLIAERKKRMRYGKSRLR